MTRLGFSHMTFRSGVQHSAYELNCIFLLDYKLKLPRYGTDNTRYVGLEVCAIVLHGTPCFQLLFTSVLVMLARCVLLNAHYDEVE